MRPHPIARRSPQEWQRLSKRAISRIAPLLRRTQSLFVSGLLGQPPPLREADGLSGARRLTADTKGDLTPSTEELLAPDIDRVLAPNTKGGLSTAVSGGEFTALPSGRPSPLMLIGMMVMRLAMSVFVAFLSRRLQRSQLVADGVGTVGGDVGGYPAPAVLPPLFRGVGAAWSRFASFARSAEAAPWMLALLILAVSAPALLP